MNDSKKSFLKRILDSLEYKVLQTMYKDFNIFSINFMGNKMFMKISGKGLRKDKGNYELLIKNMNNPENVYVFPGRVIFNKEMGKQIYVEVNLNTISPLLEQNKGRWSFFVSVKNFEVRLSPSNQLLNNLQKHTIKTDANELTIQPYVTQHGNVSIETEKKLLESSITELPNYVKKVTHVKRTIHIEGWTNLNNTKQEDVSLLINKRDSMLHYHIPITWHDKQYWKAEVSFDGLEIPRGVYDYYLKLSNGQTFRLKLEDNAFLDDNSFFHKEGLESRELLSYRTERGSLSLRCRLAYIQTGQLRAKRNSNGIVELKGIISSPFLVRHSKLQDYDLVLRQRNTDELFTIPIELNPVENKYSLELELDYKDIIPNQELTDLRWDTYLQLYIDGCQQLFRLRLDSELETDSLSDDTRKHFQRTNFYQIFFYRTVHDHIAISLNGLKIIRDIDVVLMENEELHLKGTAYLEAISPDNKNSLKRFLIIRNRESDDEIKIELGGISSNVQQTSEKECDYTGFGVKIPLINIYQLQKSEKDIFDLFIQIEYKNELIERKLGLSEYTYFKDDVLMKYTQKYNNVYYNNYLTLTPWGNLKLETNSYSKQLAWYLKYGQRIDRTLNRKRDVWIIGERPDTAQDTGYHFFKYCRETYPEKDIYYVIDPKSEDVENIKGLGNVLYLGTLEHLRKSSIATTFIGSHDLEYILPMKGYELDNFTNGKRVFLQHGVLGRKNVEYHKFYYKYPFQMFCVSSDSEQEIVKKELGYEEHEVKVTGLSRFDNLQKEHEAKRSILLIPTWREWLFTEEDFLQSEYFQKYKDLMTNETLLNLLETHDVNLHVYPHYRMQHFIRLFQELASNRVNIVELGERNVQDLLINNQLMITDYSSVSFDFNYMSKPIVFYHFDSETFFRNGILRPIEETFLGDICKTESELIGSIAYYIKNEFKEKQEITDKKYLVFNQIDDDNCERIYNEIINLN